jgi:hypothetical protein
MHTCIHTYIHAHVSEERQEQDRASQEKVQLLLDRCNHLENQLVTLSSSISTNNKRPSSNNGKDRDDRANSQQYTNATILSPTGSPDRVPNNYSYGRSPEKEDSALVGTTRGHTQTNGIQTGGAGTVRANGKERENGGFPPNTENMPNNVVVPKLPLGHITRSNGTDMFSPANQLSTDPQDIAKFLRSMSEELRGSPRTVPPKSDAYNRGHSSNTSLNSGNVASRSPIPPARDDWNESGIYVYLYVCMYVYIYNVIM